MEPQLLFLPCNPYIQPRSRLLWLPGIALKRPGPLQRQPSFAGRLGASDKKLDILVWFLFEERIPQGARSVPDSTQLLIRAENTWLTPVWLIARIEKRLQGPRRITTENCTAQDGEESHGLPAAGAGEAGRAEGAGSRMLFSDFHIHISL